MHNPQTFTSPTGLPHVSQSQAGSLLGLSSSYSAHPPTERPQPPRGSQPPSNGAPSGLSAARQAILTRQQDLEAQINEKKQRKQREKEAELAEESQWNQRQAKYQQQLDARQQGGPGQQTPRQPLPGQRPPGNAFPPDGGQHQILASGELAALREGSMSPLHATAGDQHSLNAHMAKVGTLSLAGGVDEPTGSARVRRQDSHKDFLRQQMEAAIDAKRRKKEEARLADLADTERAKREAAQLEEQYAREVREVEDEKQRKLDAAKALADANDAARQAGIEMRKAKILAHAASREEPPPPPLASEDRIHKPHPPDRPPASADRRKPRRPQGNAPPKTRRKSGIPRYTGTGSGQQLTGTYSRQELSTIAVNSKERDAESPTRSPFKATVVASPSPSRRPMNRELSIRELSMSPVRQRASRASTPKLEPSLAQLQPRAESPRVTRARQRKQDETLSQLSNIKRLLDNQRQTTESSMRNTSYALENRSGLLSSGRYD